MGKGDKKTKRGKINRGTYGTSRRRKIKKRRPTEEQLSVDTKK
ncbi:30S ribosomal protein THX [Robertkochia sediminum]|nr:30S ribosomal protein THX [Robertkochia sediminum]MBL7471626.1 30S ribosomal protein THX [Robertkochia sediminum]